MVCHMLAGSRNPPDIQKTRLWLLEILGPRRLPHLCGYGKEGALLRMSFHLRLS